MMIKKKTINQEVRLIRELTILIKHPLKKTKMNNKNLEGGATNLSNILVYLTSNQKGLFDSLLTSLSESVLFGFEYIRCCF
jgi:DNA polymerase sigma